MQCGEWGRCDVHPSRRSRSDCQSRQGPVAAGDRVAGTRVEHRADLGRGERVGDAGRSGAMANATPDHPPVACDTSAEPESPGSRSAASTSTSRSVRDGAVDVAADGPDAPVDPERRRLERPAAGVAEHRAPARRAAPTRAAAPARSRPGADSTARSRAGSNATTTASTRSPSDRSRRGARLTADDVRVGDDQPGRTTNPVPSWMRPHASPTTFTVGGRGPGRGGRVDARHPRRRARRRRGPEAVEDPRVVLAQQPVAACGWRRAPAGRRRRRRRAMREPRAWRAAVPGTSASAGTTSQTATSTPTHAGDRAADRVDPPERAGPRTPSRRRLPATSPSAWPRNAPARSSPMPMSASSARPVELLRRAGHPGQEASGEHHAGGEPGPRQRPGDQAEALAGEPGRDQHGRRARHRGR